MAIIDMNKLRYVKEKHLVEIDDKIAETILLLNRNRYNTIHSCSGHVGGEQAYITFVNNEKNIQLLKDFFNIFISIESSDFKEAFTIEFHKTKVKGVVSLYMGFKPLNRRFTYHDVSYLNEMIMDTFKKIIEEQ